VRQLKKHDYLRDRVPNPKIHWLDAPVPLAVGGGVRVVGVSHDCDPRVAARYGVTL